jgi:hypothetical protein
MNWYIAKLVYRIIYGDGLYDVHAFTKAQLLGHREENTLYDENKALIQWRFIDVCELILIDAMVDGAEILSQISEPANAKVYVKNVQRQSSQLLADSCNQCFHQN